MPNNIDDLIERQLICANCEERVREDYASTVRGEIFCNTCYNELFSACGRCGDTKYQEDLVYSDVLEDDFCSSCFDDLHTKCTECGEVLAYDHVGTVSSETDEDYCEECYNLTFTKCKECGCEIEREGNEDHCCEECLGKREVVEV